VADTDLSRLGGAAFDAGSLAQNAQNQSVLLLSIGLATILFSIGRGIERPCTVIRPCRI
jgi:hypothetical protein